MSREEIEAEASKAAKTLEEWYTMTPMQHLTSYDQLAQAFAAGALHGAKSQAKLEEIKEVIG